MCVDLRVRNCFFDAAARAGKGVTGSVGPGGKRQSRRFGFFLFRIVVAVETFPNLGVLMLRFSVSRTAMLAEPAVTEIEEVIGLIQGNVRTGIGSDRIIFQATVETRSLPPLPRRGPRSAHGSDKNW
jgi:hypothetical protein